MGKVNALARDEAEAKFSTAVERASKWVDDARPIILVYFSLDDSYLPLSRALLDSPTGFASYSKQTAADRSWQEALKITRNARDELFYMLDGIRENFLCDERAAASPAVWSEESEEAYDAFMEEVEREVPSVDAAVKKIGDEL